MKKYLLALLFLQLPALAQASAPPPAKPAAAKPAGPGAALSDADRYARRCQTQSPHRYIWPQGTMLWGTKRSWNSEKASEERTSVLVSADLTPLRLANATGVTALRLEGGRLMASPSTEGDAATSGVIGTVVQGTSSDGKPVEVAICGAEPSLQDPGMVFYRIEAWNPVAQEWENPCVALSRVPDPRALAVGGIWDASGAHQAPPGKFTFACENGAITKCIVWGYKPWERRDGQSMAGLHQACTRLARADYCGNGRSHTRQDTPIDIYDRLGVLERTTEASGSWDPARASFEAEWGPDGATCIARTRDGRAMSAILQECPDRLKAGEAVDLGGGDRCTVQRTDVSPGTALLRNLSYGAPRAPASAGTGP